MNIIPLFLRLATSDRLVLIGGGAVALAKAETLCGCGGQVEVVAETVLPELKALVQRSGGRVRIGSYQTGALDGAKLVVAATDDDAVNASIAADARALRIPVNVVDAPDLCDFIFPALVDRGDVRIAVSSSGVNPTLARLVKRRIEHVLPWNLADLNGWLKDKTASVREHFKDLQARRLFWEEVLEGPVAQEVLEGNHQRADDLLAQAMETHPDGAQAALYLVGAGPGHPDLMTLRGAQILGMADVVLYDRLASSELLQRYARKDALKISVAKCSGNHSKTQDEIDALLEEYLKAGRIVVRLKGGDPGIYAHSAEEIAVAKRLGVPYQLVPGITAASGCAAYAGIPLTERGGANGVRLLTLYDEQLHDADFWQSVGLSRHETLALYMSTSKRGLLRQRLLEQGYAPTTPVLLIEQGTTPQHREFATTIDGLDSYRDHAFVTPVLMIVGDVARWNEVHAWKEAPKQAAPFFAQLRPQQPSAPLGPQDAEALHEKLAGLDAVGRLKLVSDLLPPGDGRALAFSTSFSLEDQIITHIIASEKLPVRLFTLDTGRLPEEVLELYDTTRKRYGLDIEVFVPKAQRVEHFVQTHGINGFYESVENRHLCCQIRKVEPLRRALDGTAIWISGLRHAHSASRADKPFAEWDETHQLMKVYPVLDMDDETVWRSIRADSIPFNPMFERGYPSVGCAPCTRAVAPGEHPRAGRWWWEQGGNSECGLHVVDGRLVRKKEIVGA